MIIFKPVDKDKKENKTNLFPYCDTPYLNIYLCSIKKSGKT